MYYDYLKTDIGLIEIIEESGKIVRIHLVETIQNKVNTTDLLKEVKKQLQEYFTENRKVFNFEIDFAGTTFQKKVWRELSKIPYGETVSYQDIASRIGNPRAVRAVGGAVHKNPLLIVVPCHRVIGKNGNLIGFACGLDIKRKLLNLENIIAKQR